MRPRRSLPIFLAYAAGALMVLGFLAQQQGGEFFFAPVLHVRAQLATAAQLVPGDDVTIAGLRVGKVDRLAPLAEGGAEAQLLIHREFLPLHSDARAVVRAKNLLGETYIELNRGDANDSMREGGLIPFDHTLTPVELNQVLDALNPTVRDRLVIAINSLGAGLAGRGANLNAQAGDFKALAADLRSISGTLSSNAQHLDRLLISLSKILTTLATFHAEFRALITDWDRVMQALADREKELQGTIAGQDRVMKIFDAALSGSSPDDIRAALAAAPQTLDDANHYLDQGSVLFSTLQPEVPDINTTFQRLASAFSAQDSSGNHYWRVYCSSACFQASGVGPGH